MTFQTRSHRIGDMSKIKSISAPSKKATAAIITGLIFLGFMWFMFHTLWNGATHGFFRMLAGGQLFIVVVVVTIALAVLALVASSKNRDALGLGLLISAGAVFVVGGVGAAVYSSYLNDNALYNASKVQVKTDGDSLSFKNRVPYEVAAGVSGANLGDLTGDVTGVVKIAPGTGQYSTGVTRRGFLKGYEAVQTMNLPEYGQPNIAKDIKFCKFDEKNAPYKLGGGWWSNNLDYRILNAAGGWTTAFDDNDVTMTCNSKGEPVMYVPIVKSKVGFLKSYDVPAGVVTYNGKTGVIEYHKEMTSADGITLYPSYLAREQRVASQSSGSFADYLFNRSGFEDTSDDEEDPNKENATEFGLSTTSGVTQFVTPLTPRGESKSIVALSTINSASNKYGQLQPMSIHKYAAARQATSTVASNVTANGLGGQKTNLGVFEVVPSQDGNWTATVGQKQTVVYHAVIGEDDSMTLVDASGKTVFTNKKSDGGVDKDAKATGSQSESSSSGSSSQSATAGKDLGSMSVDELQKLSNDVSAELANRAKKPSSDK